MRRWLIIAVLATSAGAQQIQSWIADPSRRVYPGSFGRESGSQEIALEAARNETAIFQLAVKSGTDMTGVAIGISDLRGPGLISRSYARVRYPELIPVDENGQLTPDPLAVKPSVDLKANQAQGVWCDISVPTETPAGVYRGEVTVARAGAQVGSFTLSLNVLPFAFPSVSNDHFYLNILMDPGSIARMHDVARWSEAHWALLDAYVKDWANHSQDAITVFFIEDPWEGDTGFPVAGVVDWKLAGAWSDLKDPQFSFDYAHFDRFVEMCLRAGIRRNLQAWSPVNMPHHDYAVIHYRDTSVNQPRTLKVNAGTPEYERVWSQFAKSFEQHLHEKRWLEITTVGLDEISTVNLDKIVPVFRKVAPNLKLMVSGGDEAGKYQEFSPEMAFHFGYIKSEVPLPDTAERRKHGKRTLIYTANTPYRPNTFLFSEPLESRMIPWLIWKYDFDGYIRWAWNFWLPGFRDQPRYKWHSGDMFLVYPGRDGPVDSIRSEMLRQGAQDYECLYLVREQLDRIRKAGRTAVVSQAEERVKAAVELATQEDDPVRPHRPLPSDIPEARRKLNRVLQELLQIQ